MNNRICIDVLYTAHKKGLPAGNRQYGGVSVFIVHVFLSDFVVKVNYFQHNIKNIFLKNTRLLIRCRKGKNVARRGGF